MKPRVGVMERVLAQPREGLLAVASSLGFDGVELEVRGDPHALRAEMEDAGIAVSSLICDADGLGSEEEEERSIARARLLQAVDDAADLGAGGVLLPHFQGDLLPRFLGDVASCTAAAELRGVVIAWEGPLDAAGTRAAIEEVGSPAFRCYFDLANAAKRGADPAEELRSLGELVYQVHAKNLNKQPLDAPGVELRTCLKALREREYGGWIVLETAPGADPLESARHNLGVVRRTLDELY